MYSHRQPGRQVCTFSVSTGDIPVQHSFKFLRQRSIDTPVNTGILLTKHAFGKVELHSEDLSMASLECSPFYKKSIVGGFGLIL